MTKRILAVVLALVLCLSMLSVQAFAIDTWTITPSVTDIANSTSKTVAFTWNAPTGGADYYTVTVALGNTTIVNGTRVTNTTYTFTANNSGDYSIIVRAYKNASSIETAIYTGTASVFIAQTSNGTGGLKVSSVDNNNTKIEWTAQPGNPTYYVAYTLSDGKVGGVEASTNSCTVSIAYASLRTINVYQGTQASHGTNALATWSNNGSAGTGNGSYGTGGVGLQNNTLYWSSYGNGAYYYVYFYLGNSTNRGSVTGNGPTQQTNVSVASIISSYGYSNSITFEVVLATTGAVIGTYYYAGNNFNNTTNYGFNVTPYYNGYATATWNAYNGADRYIVTATVNGATTYSQTVYTTSDANIKYSFGYVTTISVQAASGNRILGAVGTATINANGQVSYTGVNGSQFGSWGNGGVNGNTVAGYNCILTVGAANSYLQWNSTIAGPYSILIIPEGGLSQTYNVGTVNFANIPLGQNTSFQVIVYTTDTRATVAQATYNASTRNTNTDTSKIKSSITNLTVTNSTSNTVTISWTAVSGASSYEIEYAPLSSVYYNTGTTRTTSFSLPYGKNSDFEAYVYAYVGAVKRSVGSIVHKAGDEFTSSTNDKNDTTKPADPAAKPADTTPAYVTGFKGTVGTSGSITLAWNAASGKPTYDIYYKKTSSSTWKKLYSTTARSLKVNKLTNDTSYDFKVVANGKDSGILTMTIGTTSSTKTAADPGATSSASAPSMTSASGGSGSISASWTSVSGANLYRVYIAEDGETTYKTKKTAWSTSSTSLTLTGVSKGTYKVRVKASTDNGKTWTDLADCDYLTVTVK